MKALKVLWRQPGFNPCIRLKGHQTHDPDQLYSALPTPLALDYRKNYRTTPSVGKIMVYLPSKMDRAKTLCWTASRPYWRGQLCPDALKGEMEVWRVDCHNLYRIEHIVWAGDLGQWEGEELERFWEEMLKADPKGFDETELWPLLAHTINPCDGIWTTDWVIPRKLLATYDIRLGKWIP